MDKTWTFWTFGSASAMRSWIRSLVCVAVAGGLSGCFTYSAVERSDVSPGSTVRVTLDRAEAIRQVEVLGSVKEHVEGRIAEQSTDETLALTLNRNATPSEAGLFNTYLTLPWTGVSQVEVKRFSPLRTTAVVAGASVVAAVILSVMEGSSTPGDGEAPPTNDAIRIPLIRIHW